MAHQLRKTALAALTFDLKPGATEIQLLPDGAFRSSDGSGRPAEVAAWHIDADIARVLLAKMAAKPNKILIDYEHQTLYKEQNGKPAPAAGWFVGTSLEYRPGQGIFAINPEWAPRAADYIAGDEYKYISPVFAYDRLTGAVVDIRMSALTNDPGLTGMAEVALTALNNSPTQEDRPVNETLKKLLAALGLPETTTEEAAITAVSDIVAKLNSETDKVAALTAKAPDPAKFVPISTMQALQTEVAALTASINGDKVDQIVSAALTAGKLLPAQKEWAIELGKSNLAALTSYVEKTPAIAALMGTQTDGKKPDGAQGEAALTAMDEKVMGQLGLTKEAFLAAR